MRFFTLKLKNKKKINQIILLIEIINFKICLNRFASYLYTMKIFTIKFDYYLLTDK